MGKQWTPPAHPRASSWYCLRTKVKGEQKARTSLRRIGLNPYMPEMKIERQHRRSKEWITTPLLLLPGYIFVEMPPEPPSWAAIKGSDGIKDVLGVAEQDGETKPFQVNSGMIERLMAMQMNLEFDDTRAAKIRRREIGRTQKETITMRFPVGTKVRAIDGPFAAFRGHVTNVTAQGEVEALIKGLVSLVPVTFPAEWLEEISEAA